MNTEQLNSKHDEAMNLASLADLAKMRNKYEEANQNYRRAFELELDVAYAIMDSDDEPNRSVILRSAASLALTCGEYREAEKLIATALAGDPPPSIASQLRELYLQVIPQLQQAVGD